MAIGVIFWIAIFVMALVVLIKASDYFTESASKVGLYLGMPAFIIGVTIVAIGTSLPELFSSVIAVLAGASEIVIGNVIGSNITNIFLILGIAAVFGKKLKSTYGIIHVDLPMLVGSAMLFGFLIWDRTFTMFDALLSVAGIILYLVYAISIRKKHPDGKTKKRAPKKSRKEVPKKEILILILSGVFIYFGAKYTIESVIVLSSLFNIGKEIIAASVVALGTSLPELVVSISAARKGKSEMAIGNILGSNIFNVLGVMGIAGLFGAISVPASMFQFALPLMLGATLLYVFVALDNEVTSWEGWLFLLFYVFYIGKLFFV